MAEDSNNNILVSVFYIGHGVSMNGITSTEGDEGGKTHDIEEFLRQCSAIGPNVYSMGFLDCCRRDRGRGGMFTNLDECKNILTVYREPTQPYNERTCNCEPHLAESMASKIFDVLVEAKRANKGVSVIGSDIKALISETYQVEQKGFAEIAIREIEAVVGEKRTKRPWDSAGAAGGEDGSDIEGVVMQKRKRVRRRNKMSKGERETIEEENAL